MQIRRIVLISFLLLLSVISLPLMSLMFFSSRATLEAEISHNLSRDAMLLMREVDMLMFERMQNVHSWSRLDIIQEARIGDVDKRLSQFLSDVESGYKGMYRSLFYTDAQQQVIAASAAELIGSRFPTAADDVRAEIPNGQVFVETLKFSQPPYQDAQLVIHTPVYDRYSSAQIGRFYGLFAMQQLFNLLDEASSSSSGDRYIVLLDGEGKVLAASQSLRKPDYLLSKVFSDWKPEKGKTVFVHNGSPVAKTPVLVGYAGSGGYRGYVRMGWSILIFQSTAEAFLPIRSLWFMFGLVIVMTMLLALIASHWVAGRIAKPLLSLTAWVREVRDYEKLAPPGVSGAIEIRQLEKAFREVFQELENSREHVIQTAKLAVVGEMSAIMAHEVRTPLGIITTSAQWLQTETGLSAEGREMAQFILDESVRLRKLVTTLLECARPREPRMLQINVHELLAHVLGLLSIQAEQKSLQIDRQLTAQQPLIQGDSELLTQVFLNLLVNAIQIVPKQGKICISSYSLPKHLAIEIADNGPGINPADYSRLFEPFFTKRQGGIGLGLTVTRQIVLAHHGEISVSASNWGGACFKLTLPITQD